MIRKTSISYLAIYDSLEQCIVNDVHLAKHKKLIKIFNNLYNLHLKSIGQLSDWLLFEIGQFKPTKDINGHKICRLKDIIKAHARLDTYLLSFIDW